MNIGTRIAVWRKSKGLTLAQVAERLDVTASAVCLWERAKSQPHLARLKRVSKLIGVPYETLLDAHVERTLKERV